MLTDPKADTKSRPCHAVSALLFMVLLLVLGGCVTNPVQPSSDRLVATAQSGDETLPRWWYVRFRLQRGADKQTDSYLDTLIADQILAPVIKRYGSDIELWRFHRRWPEDATGHQFSFIFFAPVPRAREVLAQIEQARMLRKLKSDGYLLEFRIDQASPDRAADPAATSDASWSPEIQREWPKFIMGASRMWLGLIQAEAAKNGKLDLYARYQAVEVALEDLWFAEGNHAFFHHLSALFGYKPMRVIRQDIMTF